MGGWTENKVISLNSKYGNQINGSMLSNMVFPFTGILRKEASIKHAYVAILNAQFPVSFYVINNASNVLKLYDPSTTATYTITLRIGNYTVSTLTQEILYQIAQGNPYPYPPGIDFNKQTGKLTFIFPQNATILSSQSSIREVLGLGTTNLTGTVITCPYPVNLLGVKLLNITSNALAVSSYSSVSASNMNILATVPVDAPFFNMISYENQNDLQKHELTTEYVNAIDIQILDEAGNYVDFNGTNWSFTIAISIERTEVDKQNVDLHKSLLSHNLLPEENIITDEQPDTSKDVEAEERNEVQVLDSFENPVPDSADKSFMSQLINGATDYTTNVKHIIKQFGNETIEGITLKRTPISKAIYQALNTASLGKFDSSNPYDKLFHLAMDIKFKNGRTVRLEKNATINMTTRPVDKKDT
jgi:hypothetical protein